MSARRILTVLGSSPRGRTTIRSIPACVVPKMIAPVQGHSKLQGAHYLNGTPRLCCGRG